MCIVLTASLLQGALITRNTFNLLKNRYEVTGRFYIEHLDKVVFSELPASWYLGGLQALYHLNHPFILSAFPQQFNNKKVSNINEMWRYQHGQMIPDLGKWTSLYQNPK